MNVNNFYSYERPLLALVNAGPTLWTQSELNATIASMYAIRSACLAGNTQPMVNYALQTYGKKMAGLDDTATTYLARFLNATVLTETMANSIGVGIFDVSLLNQLTFAVTIREIPWALSGKPSVRTMINSIQDDSTKWTYFYDLTAQPVFFSENGASELSTLLTAYSTGLQNSSFTFVPSNATAASQNAAIAYYISNVLPPIRSAYVNSLRQIQANIVATQAGMLANAQAIESIAQQLQASGANMASVAFFSYPNLALRFPAVCQQVFS